MRRDILINVFIGAGFRLPFYLPHLLFASGSRRRYSCNGARVRP